MCKIACKFYKEGENIDENEKLQCGGFKILKYQLNNNMINRETLEKLAEKLNINIVTKKELTDMDKFLVKNLCKVACNFYDKEEHGEGDEELQCGGYKIVKHQLEKGIIDPEMLKKICNKL